MRRIWFAFLLCSLLLVSARQASPPSSMPVGDLPGWHQIFSNDFTNSNALKSFSLYGDGVPDTAGQQGYPSMYEPSKVLSVSGGMLNENLHTVNGVALGAAIAPILPGHADGFSGQLYGRYAVRFKTTSEYGTKLAWLLWPDSGVWPGDGEIDFPEANLDLQVSAFVHPQGGGTVQSYGGTAATAGVWHTAVIDWLPTGLTFTLDGQVLGTDTVNVPDTPMHWVLQTESCQGWPVQHGNPCPAVKATGTVQIDWVTVYAKD